MAEFAEGNLELMREELQTLRSSKLFSEKELSNVIKSRRKLEYALLKHQRSVSDYVNYIGHEKDLLVLLRKRKKKNKVNDVAYEAEKSIMDRIVRLHRQLCYRFQSSPAHWLAFIAACDTMQRHHTSERVWTRMLQVHNSTDPQLWIGAAQWTLRVKSRALSKEASKVWQREKANALRALYAQKHAKALAEAEGEASGSSGLRQEKRSRLTIRGRDIGILREAATTAQLTPWFHSFDDSRDLLLRGIHFHPHSVDLQLELVKNALAEWHFFTQTEMGSEVRQHAARLQTKKLRGDDQLVSECHALIQQFCDKWSSDCSALARLRDTLHTEFPQFPSLCPSEAVQSLLSREDLVELRTPSQPPMNESLAGGHDARLRSFLRMQLHNPVEALKWFETYEGEHSLMRQEVKLFEVYVRLAFALDASMMGKLQFLVKKYEKTFEGCAEFECLRKLISTAIE